MRRLGGDRNLHESRFRDGIDVRTEASWFETALDARPPHCEGYWPNSVGKHGLDRPRSDSLIKSIHLHVVAG
jgi:hypothetical protein